MASSDNNLADLAGENPLCPRKTEVILYLCSCVTSLQGLSQQRAWYRDGTGRGGSEGTDVQALVGLLAAHVPLRVYRVMTWHDSPQPVSYKKIYLKPGKLPCTAGERLCTTMLLPKLSAFKHVPSWCLPCCSFCSPAQLNTVPLLAFVMLSLLQQIASCHPCKQGNHGPPLLGIGSPPWV